MKAFRTALYALAFACPLAGLAQETRPIVIEETRGITPPDSTWRNFGAFGVAIDGDYALVSGERFVDDPHTEGGVRHDGAAFLYFRIGTEWHYLGTLGAIDAITEFVRPGLAMKGGVALVMVNEPQVWERVGNQWSQSPITAATEEIQGPDIVIHNGRILVARMCTHRSVVYSKVGTTWEVEGDLPGHTSECGDNPPSWSEDLLGDRAIIFNEPGENSEPPVARLYRRNESGSGWRPLAVIENQNIDTVFGPGIAMTGPYIALTGSRERGTSVLYESNQSWAWSLHGLQPVDGYLQPHAYSGADIERAGPFFAQSNYSFDRKAYVINLFRVNNDTQRTNTHVATLQSINGQSLSGPIDACRTADGTGTRIIASGPDNAVRIFDVPNQFTHFPVALEDWDGSGGLVWNSINGTNFRVVNNGESNVLRQRSSSVDGGAWLPQRSSRNQSIQAEITIHSTNGTDRWAGLVTRYTDNNNHYYVTLRRSGSVQLRRRLNGEITTLASAPANVVLGRKYRLRLESIGTAHRVYLDDRLMLTAHEFPYPALLEGSPGIRMYRAVTDFDNVIVTPSPLTTIYTQNFATDQPGNWSMLGQWRSTGGTFRQSSAAGDARAVIGGAAADQIIQARVRPLSFNGANRWVGVIARYRDANNYLYVSLRNNNTLALRRLVNGQIQPIAEVPYAVNTGTWYTLRLEIVRGVTRVYVNNRMEISTTSDPGPVTSNPADSKGSVGLAMYRATAEFDDFLAYQP